MNKTPDLLHILEEMPADVIIGTESWLITAVSDSEICPNGFTLYRHDRANGKGGGVFIMVSNKYISSDPGITYPKEIEMVWTQLQVKGSKTISICSFYRPPNTTDPMYLDALNDAIINYLAPKITFG